MSLDLSFWQIENTEKASFNITHNCNTLANALGVYEMLWHTPDDTLAKTILPEVNRAIEELSGNLEKYKQYDSPNGWGSAEGFLRFLRNVRGACEEFPEATLYADV